MMVHVSRPAMVLNVHVALDIQEQPARYVSIILSYGLATQNHKRAYYYYTYNIKKICRVMTVDIPLSESVLSKPISSILVNNLIRGQ